MKSCRSLVILVLPTIAVNGFQAGTPFQSKRSLHSALIPLASVVFEVSPVTDATDVLKGSNGELPLVLQSIVDERHEFQLNLGKAMDTLRKDYPEILQELPDFSIYHDDISVVDPAGVQLTGLPNYQSSFAFSQTIIRVLYSAEKSHLQYRIIYDFARSSIRVGWNVVLYPKMPMGGPLHVDGISMYKLDSKSGKITEHRIENLVVNDTPVAPPYGMFQIIKDEILARNGPHGVPVGAGQAF